MTTSPVPEGPWGRASCPPPKRRERLARSGSPWTDDDYEHLVRLCRDGADAELIAQNLQRSASPVVTRARGLLPLDQRGVPFDRVLHQLRQCLAADADYDWAKHLATPDPPRPIVQQVMPPARYAGIEGLTDDQLVVIADALVQTESGDESNPVLVTIGREVGRRGLTRQVGRLGAGRAEAAVDRFVNRATYGSWSGSYDGPPGYDQWSPPDPGWE